MRVRYSWLIALIFTFGIQAVSIPARAAATGSEPNGQHCSQAAEGKLTLGDRIGKAKRFLGYLIPIIPTIKTTKDVNKRFFVFVEQPLIGVINTPISAWVSKSLKWFTSQMQSYYHDGKFLDVSIFKDWFAPETISNFAEAYFSFNIAAIFRNGISIDGELSQKEKLLWNYWYSAATYGIITGGTAYAQADTPQKMIFAHATVAYAFVWPLLSQYMGVKFITPYLFNKFPNKKELDEFKDMSVDRVKFLEDLSKKIEEAKTSSDKNIATLQSKKKWAEFFWKGLKKGEKVPKGRYVKYWMLKTKSSSMISISMVALYFTLRWALVGPSSDASEGHVLPMIVNWMQDALGRTPAQEIPKIKIDPVKMNKDLEFFAQVAKAYDGATSDGAQEFKHLGKNPKIVELDPETVEYGYALQQDFIGFLERFDATANSIDTEPVSP